MPLCAKLLSALLSTGRRRRRTPRFDHRRRWSRTNGSHSRDRRRPSRSANPHRRFGQRQSPPYPRDAFWQSPRLGVHSPSTVNCLSSSRACKTRCTASPSPSIDNNAPNDKPLLPLMLYVGVGEKDQEAVDRSLRQRQARQRSRPSRHYKACSARSEERTFIGQLHEEIE